MMRPELAREAELAREGGWISPEALGTVYVGDQGGIR